MGNFKLRITGDLGFEVWQDIPGYEGYYQASTYGRIRNVEKGRVLKGSTNGRYKTILVGGKKYKRYYVHRLVAIIFIPIPDGYKNSVDELEIDHIDGDINNNSVSNLRWCTTKENCNYDLHKENLSKSLKGKAAWNKGIKRFLSEEAYCEISKKAKERLKVKTKHPMYNKGKVVFQYSSDGVFIKSWDNAERAAESVGCSSTLIYNCCKNKPHYKTAGGYIWRYA